MGILGLKSAVGWNCTNSTSAQATPARSAIARPSPVASTGLVVAAKTWPEPPVANRTWRERISCTAPLASMARTPTQRPASTTSSNANHCSQLAAAVSRTSSTRARSISAPVAAPPAWTMRAWE